MDFSSADSLVLVGILAAAAALLAIAELIRIPYPIPLVLGGLALGFVPGMPPIELPPDIVLVAVLPRSSTARPSSARYANCVRMLARSGSLQSGSS